MSLARCLAALVLLIGFAAQMPSGAQQLYRWVDENGRVQYSDRPPPPGASSQTQIKKKPRSSSQAAASRDQQAPAPKSYAEQEAEFRKRQVEKAEQEAKEKQEKQAAAERKRQCDEARNYLGGLKAGAQFVKYNAAGEREYLDDKARAEEIKRAEKTVAAACT
jgi:hypothetical protein